MRTLILCGCVALLLTSACNNATKEKKVIDSATKAVAEQPVDSAAMMKAWEAYMTPGDMHKMLTKMDGSWDEEITHWMSPGAPPTTNKASCTNKMILGGRYQQSVHSGNFDGMPFEGISTLAYDNTKKVFINTWIDNMGTGIMYLEGNYDQGTKTITLKGKTVDVSTGKDIEMKETLQIIDDNNHYMEMFDIKNGKENKTMAIKFTRRK